MIGAAWVGLHAGGLTATALHGRTGFLVYLAVFLLAEAVGLLTGHPMTKYIRRWLRVGESRPFTGLAVALLVLGWCMAFVALCATWGPFSAGLNAFIAALLLGVWLVPHFFGNRW